MCGSDALDVPAVLAAAGIEAPLDEGDDHTFAAEQRQKPPKQNAHRAFGIEGEGR